VRAFAPVAVLLCFSCVIVMNEETSSRDTGLPDAGTDGGHGGGGGGSGGDLDGSIYWGDGGHDPPHGFPGSGQEGDPGTAVLLFFRIDRGTADLAAAEETMAKQLIAALESARLVVSSVTAIDLYAGGSVLWRSIINTQPSVSLADVLRARAAQIDTAPSACTTLGPVDFGRSPGLLSRAVLVAIVEHGPRPQSASCDTLAGAAVADPTTWLRVTPYPIPRAQMRYLFISTSETLPADQMQSACLATAGFPPFALDALAPSPQPFFDALAPRFNAGLPNLATRIDLCEALGSGWQTRANELAKGWSAILQLQP